MRIFHWFSELFSSNSLSITAIDSSIDDFTINPASGLPMVDGMSSVDVAGNPYCMNNSNDFSSSFSSSSFDSFSSCGSSSSFDNDW